MTLYHNERTHVQLLKKCLVR